MSLSLSASPSTLIAMPPDELRTADPPPYTLRIRSWAALTSDTLPHSIRERPERPWSETIVAHVSDCAPVTGYQWSVDDGL